MSRVVQIHRTRLTNLITDFEGMAGAATKAAENAKQVLERGGTLQVQPQMAYLVGTIARILKDIGVIEQLQTDGVAQPRKMAEPKTTVPHYIKSR